MKHMTQVRPTHMILAIFGLLVSQAATAACDQCPKPGVALYDLDVQVPVDTSSASALSQWWKLHFAAGWVAGTVGDDPCANFADGAMFSDTTGAPSSTLRFGVGYSHLPPSGAILLSSHDYLLTGSIASSGGGYQMNLKLETTCSREVAASVSGTFASPSEASATAVRLATQAFTPLSDKIREFEKQKRDADREVAIDVCKDAFQIVPSKTSAAPSETLPVTISLKDCDGTPLAGRKILLMGGSFKGSSLAPSTNGVFTQTEVTTDGQGKATVDYTTGPSQGLSVPRVHFVYKSPAGCLFEAEAMATIDLRGTAAYYKVRFEYTEDYTYKFDTSFVMGGISGMQRVNGFSNLAVGGDGIVVNDPDAQSNGTIDFGGPALHSSISQDQYRFRKLEEDRQTLSSEAVYMYTAKTSQAEKQGASAVNSQDKVELDFYYDPADPTGTGGAGIAVPMRYFGTYRDFKSEFVSGAGRVTKDTSSVRQHDDTADQFASASAPTGMVVDVDSFYTIDHARDQEFMESGSVRVTKSTRLKMTISPIGVKVPTGVRGKEASSRRADRKLSVRQSGSHLMLKVPGAMPTDVDFRLLDLSGNLLATSSKLPEQGGWFRWDLGSVSMSRGGLRILQVRSGRTILHTPVILR